MSSSLPRTLAATCFGFCALQCSSQSVPEPCGTRSVPLYGTISSELRFNRKVDEGYYYADLLVGNPPQRANVIIDTTSHLLSLACEPCAACGHHLDPAFVPSASRSAQWTSCGPGCPGHCVHEGPSRSGTCLYNQSFQEGSAIGARFLRDEVALAGAQQPPFGGRLWGRIGARTTDIACHEFEGGLFHKQKANGLLGLGPGRPLSDLLLSARPCPGTKQLFGSYSMCLSTHGGQLDFPATPPRNTQWIRMLPGVHNHLGLEAIHVVDSASEKIEASISLTRPGGTGRTGTSSLFSFGKRNARPGVRQQPTRAHVDSGTTYVYLPTRAYYALRRAMNEVIGRTCSRPNSGCEGWSNPGTDSCIYLPQGPQGLKSLPTIQFQFQRQRVTWMPHSYMVWHPTGSPGHRAPGSTYCYGFDRDGPASNVVLGLTFFLHRQIIFDLPRHRLGFVDTPCPQYKERPQRLAAPLPQSFTTTSYFPEAVETTTYVPWSQFAQYVTTSTPYPWSQFAQYVTTSTPYADRGYAQRRRRGGGSGFGVLPPPLGTSPGMPPMPPVPVPAPRIPTPFLRAPQPAPPNYGSYMGPGGAGMPGMAGEGAAAAAEASKQRAEIVLEKVKQVEDVVEAVLNDNVTQSLGQHLGPLLHRLPRWGSRSAADGDDEVDGEEETEEPERVEEAEDDEEEDDEDSPEGNLMLIGFAAAGGALLTALFCAGVAFGALGHARMARSGARELRDALLQTGEVEAPPPQSLDTEMEAVLPKPFTAPSHVPASSEPASAEDGVL